MSSSHVSLAQLSSPPRFYLPGEVAIHNKDNDLWVSWLGHVYNLTDLVKTCDDPKLTATIRAYAGKDISHWFNPETEDLWTAVNVKTGGRDCRLPHNSPLLHVHPEEPSTNWPIQPPYPWWRNKDYLVGKLTSGSRFIRLVNTLVSTSDTIEVCKEEPLSVIQERYAIHNRHIHSYTWKYQGRVLNMNLTLEHNGIIDDRPLFYLEGLPSDMHIPGILLYYNDDLSEM